jgi:tight adherence protein C
MMDFLAIPNVSRSILLGFIFLAVALPTALLFSYLSNRVAVRRRVQMRGPEAVAEGGSLRADQTSKAWVRLVNSIEEKGLSLDDTKSEALRKKLIAAGFTHPLAPRAFTLTRLGLTLGLPLVFVMLSFLSGNMPSLFVLWIVGLGTAAMGLYLPNLFISAKADRRRQEIINGFPDALDLMLVCVEAGLGLEAAFSRVGAEMSKSHPLLAEMLGTVVLEMRGGRSREDALRRMADRVEIDEIRSFATLLIQSSKLGSSVAQTLRIYAGEMREKRRMRAEEKAHRLPVIISVPLVGCMLPVMIGVLMLPAAIRVVRSLIPAFGG